MKSKKLVLLVQGPFILFCYYDVLKTSSLILKVFSIEEEKEIEISIIRLKEGECKIYINLKRDNLRVFAIIGNIDSKGDFIKLATSNIVNTPKSAEICEFSYENTSSNFKKE